LGNYDRGTPRIDAKGRRAFLDLTEGIFAVIDTAARPDVYYQWRQEERFREQNNYE
jgi:hypothetical protein